MSNIDISSDDLKVFLQEAETLIESLDEQIVRLEQDGASDDLIAEIFRVAHTLKGSSGMLGLEEMARLTHAMEDLFDRVRKGALTIDQDVTDVLLQCLDGISALKDAIASDNDPAVDVDGLVEAIHRYAEGDTSSAPRAQTTALVLGEAEHERIEAAAGDGRLPFRVSAALAPDSDWRAVRCFQLLNELGPLGEVVASAPTQADIEAEAVGTTFHAVVLLKRKGRGQVAPATVEAALKLIDDVQVVQVVPYIADAPVEAPAATPAPSSDAPSPDAPSEAKSAPSAVHQQPKVDSLQPSVRVDVDQLDALMNMVGELVIDRTRISQLSRILNEEFEGQEHVQALSETANHLEKMVDGLHARMMKVRMLPVGLLFSKFPRLVRDLSRSLDKGIRLEMSGEDTEIDRSVIEQIKDPLVHLIRNACDHGIEDRDARAAAGKPELSILHLSAKHEQGQIVISLEDDGAGIDAARVKAKAVERGLIPADQAERMGLKEAVDLIFEAGLSTAKETTAVSGRGVGMDIVRRDIEAVGGRIEVETRPGEGTVFRLRLPLTLATFRGLLVGCGATTYAIPLTYVQETLRPDESQVRFVSQRPVLHLRTRDTVMPMVRLDNVLQARGRAGTKAEDSPYVVVVRASESESDRPVAIAVDQLVGQQEVVVKSLGKFLGRSRGVSGASVMGDGQVVLIVDVPTLIKASRQSDLTAAAGTVLERIAS
ncbi:MAG: chemotaxis protein CheA [Dehalococcoidia bacterium]|nr:chemotaxis protein CheA [Dehalococcoidia bacterium]